jgi:GTP:adenosylcobinamide-phosphate guanylyltransferase
MDSGTVAVILCAGTGSRLGLPDINKCALPIGETSPICHGVKVMFNAGVSRIVVITGYSAQSVKKALLGNERRDCIEFINNPQFGFHGCNYSLSCAMQSMSVINASELIIAEGDSLLYDADVTKFVRQRHRASSLVRDISYIDYSRSVIAVGRNKNINRYVYSQTHTKDIPALYEGEQLIGESMQLWMFCGDTLDKLKRLLLRYKAYADSGGQARTDTGVSSINRLCCKITPINADYPQEWINLNTKVDSEKARNVKWLLK